jgi:hypothetical protein
MPYVEMDIGASTYRISYRLQGRWYSLVYTRRAKGAPASEATEIQAFDLPSVLQRYALVMLEYPPTPSFDARLTHRHVFLRD